MARTPLDVTDAELGILQLLWECGPATIRQLTDALYPRGGTAQYATVQKLLERLEGKGYVARDRSASVHVFTAAVARDELIGGELRRVADRLGGSSMTPLLTCLVDGGGLTAGEKAHLRALLDGQPGAKRRPRA